MRNSLLRLLQMVLIAVLLTLLSLTYHDYAWLHASLWEPGVHPADSDYRAVRVWGWPVFYVIDEITATHKNALDFGDRILWLGFLISWWLWLLVIGTGYGLAHLLRRILRRAK